MSPIICIHHQPPSLIHYDTVYYMAVSVKNVCSRYLIVETKQKTHDFTLYL